MRPPTTLWLLTLTPLTTAHTVFTTLFIDDVSQGDGTCVRMPRDGSTSTDPIRPVTSVDMVCGRDGLSPVAFACPANAGSKLTFEFREYADASQPGALDPSHKGPCAVYLKQVDNITSSASGEGDGWFKIWDSGYDEQTQKWCTEKLIDNHGLLSIALPSALPTGYFLVRPELLALQQADKTLPDPQFYVGCAQLFVRGPVGEGKLDVPADKKVAIPGHVGLGDKGLTFNIYKPEMDLPYPVPGPRVYFPVLPQGGDGKAVAAGQNQTEGVVPATCLLKNANWCGMEVGDYADEAGCWAAAGQCYGQAKVCYDEAPPTGAAGCRVWEGKCKGIQDACGAGRWVGPPDRGVKLVGVESALPGPGPIPPVEGGEGTTVAVGGGGDKVSATAAAAPTGTTAAVVVEGTASSSASAEPTASAAPEATDSSCPAEVVSKDGVCGGELGQTCLGSEFGACCSRYGRCGSTRLHCGCGCQSAFGECK